jgi:hypothetical protein
MTAYVCMTRGFDIIHVANPPDFIVPLVSIYKLFGKRIIFDQHDLTPELYAARFSRTNVFLLWVQTLLERLSYRLADHSIVTNESYRAIALGRGGCLRSEVTVVEMVDSIVCQLDRLMKICASELRTLSFSLVLWAIRMDPLPVPRIAVLALEP